MSFLNSVFGKGPGQSDYRAQPATFDTPASVGNFNTAYGQTQGAIANQNDFLSQLREQGGIDNQNRVFAQQQLLANQLQDMSNGNGPNIAQNMLNQTTGQNVANQAALMAGQRGANSNVGLLARQIAQQGAATQQQAAGQGATMRAQQQMAALNALQGQQGQLAGLASQQVGQQAQAGQALGQLSLEQQNQILNAIANQNALKNQAQSAANNINAQIETGNAAAQGKYVGAMTNMIGSALIPGSQYVTKGTQLGTQDSAGLGTQGASGGQMVAGGQGESDNGSGGDASLGELGGMAMMFASKGGKVPGQPEVFGDSEKNDTVPAKLSPGEVVIPRSVMESADPVKSAAEFVAQVLKRGPSHKSKFDEGGMAGGIFDGLQSGGRSIWDTLSKNSSSMSDAPTPMIPDVSAAPVKPQPVGGEMMPQQAPQSPNGMSSSYIDALQKAYGKQNAGLFATAKASSDLGKDEASIYTKMANDLSDSNKEFKAANLNLEAERQKAVQAVTDGHIDPNRYMGNMTTTQRVSSIIGMMLGGVGSAFSGQSNYAMDALKSNIDYDIEAQKAEMGKKQNLLTMNMHQFGNLKDATAMTRANMLDLASAQAKAAAAKSQDPMAQARALQLSGELSLQAAQAIQPLKQQQLLWQQASMDLGGDPSRLVPLMVPKEHQKDVFNEIQQAQNASNSESQIMDLFNQANKENTAAKTGGLRTPPSIKALNALADPLIHDNEGRINELEQKHVQALWPSPGDLPNTVAMKKKALQEFIDHKKSAPTAKGFGMDLNRYKTTTTDPVNKLTPQQQQYYQWAQQNPTSPLAVAFKKKMGLE